VIEHFHRPGQTVHFTVHSLIYQPQYGHLLTHLLARQAVVSFGEDIGSIGWAIRDEFSQHVVCENREYGVSRDKLLRLPFDLVDRLLGTGSVGLRLL
jgi:hypothetical protein